ncbi:MAG TPA: wax ester/triacylglycerol synthase family O-acyltransferase, partial [Pseudonocardiaceae bacterium]|nr:wax ester/triacylglycerol synthase family O-acyltransferase [Pseudonocardiaceae bacterium]
MRPPTRLLARLAADLPARLPPGPAMALPRRDGRAASVPKARRIMPFLMPGRTESIVYFTQQLDVSAALEWLREWNADHGGGDGDDGRAGIFTLVLYCLAKLLHERPRLNRFVAGRQIYDRDGVYLSFGAKKQLTEEAPLAMVKRRFEPTDSFADVVRGLAGAVAGARSDAASHVDNELDLLLALPEPLLRIAVGLVKRLDALGALPAAFTGPDPLFTSAVVSNLGSLKMDAAFHHLYEYGNCPLFLAVGMVRPTPVAVAGTTQIRPLLTLRWTFDERIEDGLYAGRSAELMRRWIEDPASHLGHPVRGAPRPMVAPRTAAPAPVAARVGAADVTAAVRQVDELGALYLAAEDGRTTTHTAALVTLAAPAGGRPPVTLDALRELMRRRVPLVPPLRWRLAGVPLGLDRPYWREDPDLAVERHLHELTLPAPGGDAQLRAEVARLFARPLDRSRPLWEAHLINGLAGGRQAVLIKLHHAAVDGVSGVGVLATLFGPDGGQRPDRAGTPVARAGPAVRAPGGLEMLTRGGVALAGTPLRVARRLPALLADLDQLPMLGALPGAGRLSGLARAARRQPGPAAAPHLPAPRTSFNGRITGRRRLGVATLPLAVIKAVKHAHGVTVNDVVLALCAGAIRRWLIEHGELPDRPLVAVVPVSTRRSDDSSTFGNQLNAVFVPIPTDVADAAGRIAGAHQAMAAAKAHLDAAPGNTLADTARFLPPALLGRAAHLVTAVAALPGVAPAVNVNISNVRGPQAPLSCAGT